MAVTTSTPDSPSIAPPVAARQAHRSPAPAWTLHTVLAAVGTLALHLLWLARHWRIELRGWHVMTFMAVLAVLTGANVAQAVGR